MEVTKLVASDEHVLRPKRPLERFSVAEFGWLPNNTARIGNATKTGGRRWLAAR